MLHVLSTTIGASSQTRSSRTTAPVATSAQEKPMKAWIASGSAVLSVTVLAACNILSGINKTEPTTTSASVGAPAASESAASSGFDGILLDQGVDLAADLSGAAEVPGPGDADGGGIFRARLDPKRELMCYELTVTAVATSNAAHIHRGGASEQGPPVVTLDAPADGETRACVTVPADLVGEITGEPGAFYVNVHNSVHPAGAVRGQLSI